MVAIWPFKVRLGAFSKEKREVSAMFVFEVTRFGLLCGDKLLKSIIMTVPAVIDARKSNNTFIYVFNSDWLSDDIVGLAFDKILDIAERCFENRGFSLDGFEGDMRGNDDVFKAD